MKNLLFLFLAALAVMSCEDEVEFNSPAVQGSYNGNFWRAVSMSASYNLDGNLIITAHNNYETLTLNVESLSPGTTFTLGQAGVNFATVTTAEGDEYSTNYANDGETYLYPPDGEITITGFDQVKNAVSGEFWFNAYNEAGDGTVNFSQGVFFDIPAPYNNVALTSCDEAVETTTIAQMAYLEASESDSNYGAICAAYQAAIMDQLETCGANAEWQAILDGLQCTDEDGDGVYDEDVNGDGNLENDDTDGDGIPNYMDEDDDGDSILTMYEAYDAMDNPLDSDGDGILDYLDDDDDNDGILTIDENPDPNTDGNPDDADDLDGDGIPDYLDAD